MEVRLQQPRDRKCDAYIIDLDDRYLVRPSVVSLKKHDPFIICNLTNQLAHVDLRNLGGPSFDLQAGQWAAVDLDPNRAPKAYHYEVFVGGRRAHAESDPVIIIDP